MTDNFCPKPRPEFSEEFKMPVSSLSIPVKTAEELLANKQKAYYDDQSKEDKKKIEYFIYDPEATEERLALKKAQEEAEKRIALHEAKKKAQAEDESYNTAEYWERKWAEEKLQNF